MTTDEKPDFELVARETIPRLEKCHDIDEATGLLAQLLQLYHTHGRLAGGREVMKIYADKPPIVMSDFAHKGTGE